jgi:hypothetical protein
MSNACLEVSDANYREKGWGLLGFLLPGSFSLAGTVGISWMMTHIPPVYYERGQLGIIQGILGFFLVVMLCLLGVGIWALTRDCFSYTRKPIRFNRLNQTVYVFRHNGPGGVLSIPWTVHFSMSSASRVQGSRELHPASFDASFSTIAGKSSTRFRSDDASS